MLCYCAILDIPILSFQRSAFLSLDDEKSVSQFFCAPNLLPSFILQFQIVNEAIIHLLYEEVRASTGAVCTYKCTNAESEMCSTCTSMY